MALPFKGPDTTLMQLLGFVVDAGRRFATITDMKVGEGNQNAAVGTTVAMLEQGTRVMSAVHKRLHYAMKNEFKLLARVIHDFLPQEYPYSVSGGEQGVMAQDFDDRVDVVPVSNLIYFLKRSGLLWRSRSYSLQCRLLNCTTRMRRFVGCMMR